MGFATSPLQIKQAYKTPPWLRGPICCQTNGRRAADATNRQPGCILVEGVGGGNDTGLPPQCGFYHNNPPPAPTLGWRSREMEWDLRTAQRRWPSDRESPLLLLPLPPKEAKDPTVISPK